LLSLILCFQYWFCIVFQANFLTSTWGYKWRYILILPLNLNLRTFRKAQVEI
jgi:hypothetical protein